MFTIPSAQFLFRHSGSVVFPTFVMSVKTLGKKILLLPEMWVMKKNLHSCGHKFIFFNRFSGDILFSSLVSSAFFGSCFFLLFGCCFLKLKMYIFLIQIRLCGRVSDKKLFTRPIYGNKATVFFGLRKL